MFLVENVTIEEQEEQIIKQVIFVKEENISDLAVVTKPHH